MDQWDCRLSKKRRTDPVFSQFHDDLALIWIQSEEAVLLLSTRNLGHGSAPLKETWYGDVRSGCELSVGSVMGVILVRDEGRGELRHR